MLISGKEVVTSSDFSAKQYKKTFYLMATIFRVTMKLLQVFSK